MGGVALLRCDASPAIGAGHLMRCLSFAEVLSWAGWSCAFATNREATSTVPALARSGYAVHDSCADNDLPVVESSLVVMDHYHLDAVYERRLAGGGRTVIVFDDLANRPHACDILVDPTPGRQRSDYAGRVPATAQLLLGPRYAILARQWRELRNAWRGRSGANRILVSMGATDPTDATSRVLAAIQLAKISAQVDVVLGSAAPHRGRVAACATGSVKLHLDTSLLSALAAKADFAIGAAGTSSFERAVLGLPTLMVPVADNQQLIARAFAAAGAAEVLPATLLDTPTELAAQIAAFAGDWRRRETMSKAATAFTDGRGAARLLAVAAGAVASKRGAEIRLRLAEVEDEAWLLALQQQPATRRYALNSQVPNASEHARWFAMILDDEDRMLMVIDVDGEAVGMVRLDRKLGSRTIFEISIAIDERRHGERIASGALALVRRLAPGADLLATVLPQNEKSLALFAAAGYRPEGDNRYRSRVA